MKEKETEQTGASPTKASSDRVTRPRAVTARIRTLAGLVGMGLAGFSQATQSPPTAVEELALRADFVVHGRVESVETLRSPGGRHLTRVELTPVQVWKGPPTNRLGVVLASGVLGERWVKVVGEPEYQPGEEVVVFAVANEFGEAVTLQMSQGKFSVTDAGEEKFVSNGVFGGTLHGDPGARPPHLLPLRLEALRDRVRVAVNSGEVHP